MNGTEGENKAKRSERRNDMSLRDMFDQMFNDRFWLDPLDLWRRPTVMSRMERAFFPRVDVTETDAEIRVVADIPGVDPNNIDIDVIDDRMRIRGAIEQDQILRDGEQAYRRERAYGSFSREFSLPAHVKEDQIRAVCKDGVLTIVMHKVEGEKRKKITIEKA